jgi:hypothetical protein
MTNSILKTTMTSKRDYEKYNYSFCLSLTNSTVTDSIICSRDFNIFNFNPKSLKSSELKESIDRIAYIIEEDLKLKTLTYSYYIVSPFATQESLEKAQARGWYKSQLWSDLDNEFKLTNKITTTDYLTFEFVVNNKSIIKRLIDINYYPKYIRNNIDITNRPKFKDIDSDNLKFEQNLQKVISANKSDLSQDFISEFRYICAQDDKFYTTF